MEYLVLIIFYSNQNISHWVVWIKQGNSKMFSTLTEILFHQNNLLIIQGKITLNIQQISIKVIGITILLCIDICVQNLLKILNNLFNYFILKIFIFKIFIFSIPNNWKEYLKSMIIVFLDYNTKLMNQPQNLILKSLINYNFQDKWT